MNDKNLCYSCARGKVCRENPAFPCKECAGYVAEQKWISVKDRLPTKEDANKNESVIAISKEDGFGRSWIWDIVVKFHDEFSFWMPFPEPPATVSTKSE